MFIHHRFLYLIFLAAAVMGCDDSGSKQMGIPKIDLPLPVYKFTPQYFANCSELSRWSEKKRDDYNREFAKYYEWRNSGGYGSIGIPQAGAAPANSQTNVQESGVDEPDIVKVDTDHLAVARAHSVVIVSSKSWQTIQTISLPDLKDIKLFMHEERLIVIAAPSKSTTSFSLALYMNKGGTYVLDQMRELEGTLVDSRLTEGQLLLVSKNSFSYTETLPIQDTKLFGVPCSKIQKPILDDLSVTLTTVRRVDLKNKDQFFQTATLGEARQIYATKENVYLLSSGYSWFWWDQRIPTDVTYQSQLVQKLDWRNESGPKYLGAGAVLGHVNNVWSFHESKDPTILHLVTTYWGREGGANQLWALQQNDSFELKTIGSTVAFGRNEDVRSARFIGNKAYVVTFEKTDPLFTIDLADPARPTIIGELKVPGFSTYLHPVLENSLFGIGFGATPQGWGSWAQGVQFSLFDFSNPTHIEAIEQKTFGGRYSSSDVISDHHAFFFDSATQVAAIPVTLLKLSDGGLSNVSNAVEFSGAFVLDLKGGVKPVGQISHEEWIPAKCKEIQASGIFWSLPLKSMDIRRVVSLSGNLVSISPFGLKVHEMQAPYTTKTLLEFEDSDGECKSLDRLNWMWI